jgi:hypothetical protein
MLSLLGCGQGQNSVIDADYTAIINRAIALGYALPTSAQQQTQNQLLLALKLVGVWTKMDVLYVFCNNGGQNFATLNWKAPSSFQATLVNSPTFTTNVGFQGNGTSAYLNTNFNPFTSGVTYTLNNAHRMAVMNAVSGADIFDGGGGFTNNMRGAVQSFRVNMGNTTATPAKDFSGSGVKAVIRTGVNALEAINRDLSTLHTGASTTINNASQTILFGSFLYASANTKVSFYSMGGILTTAEVALFRTSFNNYLTNNGLTPFA